ncbi:MAG: Tuberous sclerosis 2-like protein [Bogoriella megaspora]|nr:MAG: Tuberous sclerosis 2-like protein [Bogoriella megaspora]
MSPSNSDAAPTPERKPSTSALLDAFRTLTSNRIRNFASASPPSAAVTNPPGELSGNDYVKAHTISGPMNGSGSSIAGAMDASGSNIDDNSATGNVVGGPPGLSRLLRQLGSKQPGQARIDAASEVTLILEEYPVQNVLAVWSLAQDMIKAGKPDNESLAGYDLLKACIDRPGLTAYERRQFFNSILNPSDPTNFDLRLGILIHLTEKGRNIEGLETSIRSRLAPALEGSFKRTIDERDARKASRRSQATRDNQRQAIAPAAQREEKSFYTLLDYIKDVTKYNAKIFVEEDIVALLNTLLQICRGARTKVDILKCLEVMDGLMTYFYVPKATLSNCLEIMCDVIQQLPELREAVENVLRNLFGSHLGEPAMTALVDLVRQSPQSQILVTALRGAITVLHQFCFLEREGNLPEIPLSYLLEALKCCLDFDRSSKVDKLELDVLNFVADLVEHSANMAILNGEQDLTEVLEIIEKCAKNRKSRLRSRRSISTTNEHSPSPHSSESGKRVTAEDPLLSASSAYDRVVVALLASSDDVDASQKSAIVHFFLRLDGPVNDNAANFLIKHFVDENLFFPSNERWLDDTQRLIELIIQDQTRPAALRVFLLNTLQAAYGTVAAVVPLDIATEFAKLVINNIVGEIDPMVMEASLQNVVDLSASEDEELFRYATNVLEGSIFNVRSPLPSTQIDSSAPLAQAPSSENISKMAAECFVRIFMRNLLKSASRAQRLYEIMLRIAGSTAYPVEARIVIFKVLFRLRSDASHALMVISSAESESLAAALCRTVETAHRASQAEGEHTGRASRAFEDSAPSNIPRVPSGSTNFSFSRPSTRSPNAANMRPGASYPLWMYPGPRGLPEEPPSTPSPVLFSSLATVDDSVPDQRRVLKMGLWLELLISILQNNADWEIFSYIIVHLGAQLANQSLFHDAIPQVKLLRSVICDQVRNHSFHEPPNSTGLKKADVAVCVFHTLTMLISYHDHFGKSEEEDMVKIFQSGIGAWDRTSQGCIHALSVCCFEIPASIRKSLTDILQSLSRTITQSRVAVHILEFLATVARLPELFKNFRDEDFKIVFGICFRYLQYARDQADKTVPTSSRISQNSVLRRSRSSREFATITEQEGGDRSTQGDLPQYVYALAFHVITFFFMSMKLQDRPQHVPFITKGLTYTDQLGREIVEEQGQVTLDMMKRVTYSDRDETVYDHDFAQESDGEVSKRTWLVGFSLLTIETAGRSGVSQITVGRPSGTRHWILKPNLARPSLHQVSYVTDLEAELFRSSAYVGIYPEDILQEVYAPMFLSSLGSPGEQPIPLRDDEITNRAISIFNRVSALDSYGIGVIYIGEGQTDEAEILANVSGSSDYTDFILSLGTLVRLKDAQINLQGLDRETGIDGDFTYCWRDRVSEIIFHIPTMMPTNLEDDRLCTQKKSHVGNDFVNIIFNNSGLPFRFDTFPSAFNYVYIVITPEARSSFVETRLHTSTHSQPPSFPANNSSEVGSSTQPQLEQVPSNPDPSPQVFYKVTLHTHPSFPAISPAADTKPISASSLPSFVRLLALNASVFSAVWASHSRGQDYISSWRSRLRQIKQLRERYAPPPPPPTSAVEPMSAVSGASSAGAGWGSGSEVVPGGGGALVRERTPGATASAPPATQGSRESMGGMDRRKSAGMFWGEGLRSSVASSVRAMGGGGGGSGGASGGGGEAMERDGSQGSSVK